jgi:hypothetical protein
MMNWTECERKLTYPNFSFGICVKGLRKPAKKSISTAGQHVEILTGDFLNVKKDCYPFIIVYLTVNEGHICNTVKGKIVPVFN